MWYHVPFLCVGGWLWKFYISRFEMKFLYNIKIVKSRVRGPRIANSLKTLRMKSRWTDPLRNLPDRQLCFSVIFGNTGKKRAVIFFISCWRVYVKVKYLQAFLRNYTPRLINLYRLPPKFRVILRSICRACLITQPAALIRIPLLINLFHVQNNFWSG